MEAEESPYSAETRKIAQLFSMLHLATRTLVFGLGFTAFLGAVSAESALAEDVPQTVRCAVVGGLNESNFWPDLTDRFQRATGHKAEIVAAGPKQTLIEAFRAGEADLLVMHTSDAAINLVADGVAENPQPWARNDFIIVGPAADPARVKGEKDAVPISELSTTIRCSFP